MEIFWNKYNGIGSWTDDPILTKNKFTNVYRASDRVSQYMIKHVIYDTNERYNEEDVILKILFFKIFNKIETWKYLEENGVRITVNDFNVKKINLLLSERIQRQPIFSAAYMMTGSHKDFIQYKSKHEKWLRMIDKEFINNGLIYRIIKSKSLEEVFNLLLECPFIGNFLAYQYAIDFNYSEVLNFDENSFVKAGVGAIRGIKKCFVDINGYSYEDVIRFVQDNLYLFREKYGYSDFKNLFGREPTLIDLQNCFCETDKYLRAKMPELKVDNTRIKQKYKPGKSSFNYFFPPKWNINNRIENKCSQ
ncbi:MAG: putative DNA base hypermodification protein [Bacteroidia bacterium]|nr:putative DNA base hypermodification protein [Bacteroidia bacterium]